MILVSAFYNIPNKLSYTFYKGKGEVTKEQSNLFYMVHIQYLFRHVKAPMIFFTSTEHIDDLRQMAGDNVTFVVKEFEEMDIFKSHPPEFWIRELAKDDPKFCHSWQIGALWANKMHFVDQASRLCPDEQWFMWIDAGCIRKEALIPLLEDLGTRNFIPLTGGIYLQYHEASEECGPLATYASANVAAGIFVCDRASITQYIDHFHQILDEYSKSPLPAISDQVVVATIANRYKDYIHLIKNKLNVPDDWFFFLACI